MAIHNMRNRLRSEVGVSLIHVALMVFIVTGFSAFVLDHGVMMLGRGQAQNVADAAALTAITTRLKDEPGDADPPANGLTVKSLQQAVDAHTVFGGTPANTGRTWNWTCPVGVTNAWCVQVNVYRDGTNGSTMLPVYFSGLLGAASSQKVRATATAVAKSANGTRCMKPWLIPDKWNDVNNNGVFDKTVDTYTPHNFATDPPTMGTGWTTADVGTTVILHGGPGAGFGPSFYFGIEPDGSTNSGKEYQDAIEGCTIIKQIGDTVNSSPGGKQGPTDHGVDNLLAANGGQPVDVIVGMFSPLQWADDGQKTTGNFDLTIVNMMSIKILSANPQGDITGQIVGGVGEMIGPGPTPSGNGSLIRTIQLVR